MMDSKDNGRLVLTLCKSDARESYYHAIVSLPESYEAAVNEARQVFQPYIDRQIQASNIVLKCALKRANGTGAWGILRPTDWMKVIRPDGDEVGVFLRQDSLDLPYEPRATVESDKAGSDDQGSKVQQPQHNIPPLPASTGTFGPGTQMETKIMYLTFMRDYKVYPGERRMIKVPVTYQACQRAAYNAFKADLHYGAKENDVILQIKRGRKFGGDTKKQKRGDTKKLGSLDSYSVVTPEAYSILLSESTSGDCIDLVVCDPGPKLPKSWPKPLYWPEPGFV